MPQAEKDDFRSNIERVSDKTHHPIVTLILRNHGGRALACNGSIVAVRRRKSAAAKHIVDVRAHLPEDISVHRYAQKVTLTTPGLTMGSMRVRTTGKVPPKMTWTAKAVGKTARTAASVASLVPRIAS